MTEAFFQHIPRCLFEPVAILGLIGFCLFLFRNWKRDRAESVLFGGTVLFMIGWRMMMPINADRYALLLIPAALFMSVTAIEEIIAFCRRFVRLPDYRFFVACLLVACLVKAYHGNAEDRQFFRVIDALKKELEGTTEHAQVISNRNISFFLGDRCSVRMLHIGKPFRLADLPQGRYYLLKLSWSNRPLDADEKKFVLLYEAHKKDSPKFRYVLWRREEE